MNCGHKKAHIYGMPMGEFGHMGHIMKNLRHFMPYDLEETEENYIVEMPLPGFDVNDIEVSVRGNQIAIDAKYEEEGEKPKEMNCLPHQMGKYFWKRPIHVKIDVEEQIVPDQVKARLKKGILHIVFQKKPKISVPIKEEED